MVGKMSEMCIMDLSCEPPWFLVQERMCNRIKFWLAALYWNMNMQHEAQKCTCVKQQLSILTQWVAHMNDPGTPYNPSRSRGRSGWDACLPVLTPAQLSWDLQRGPWGWAQSWLSILVRTLLCLQSRTEAKTSRLIDATEWDQLPTLEVL